MHAPLHSISQIIGQDRAVATLRAVLQSGRVHHAWIFSGPQGVGKRTTAEAFAAMLLDPTTGPNLMGEIEPDPESETQHLLAHGNHPDLHIITKELAEFADEARVRTGKQITIAKDVIDKHLLQPIALAPTIHADSLAQKVFIIDEAELLDRSKSDARTQASMLKTLEEPAPGSVIILVTSNEDRLLTTIRSRCQRVVFGSLDEASMRRWLDQAQVDLSSHEEAWTLEFAQGSPGRLALAVDTGLYEWSQALGPELAALEKGRFPARLGSTMTDLVGAWATAWVSERKNASKEAANHAAARHMFTLLGSHLRRCLRGAADGDEPGVQRILRQIELLTEAERHIATNVQMTLVFDNLAMQMSEA